MRLLEAVNAYVEGRRTFGAAYPDGSPTLDALCRYAGDIPLRSIRERQIAAFLDGPTIKESTWQNKYRRLRHFFLFWLARNAIPASPMPPQRAIVESPFIPYVYSRSEIHRLLSIVRIAQKNSNCKIDTRTVRTVILFLYGTGALLS